MLTRLLLSLLPLLLCTPTVAELKWERVKLDDAFRSEGVAVADLDRDGKKDVIAGDVWYSGADWTMRGFRPVGEFVAGKGYSNSFANFAWDINADGWTDIIVVGFPGAPFHWYENPGEDEDTVRSTDRWEEHVIWHSICNESPEFEDLDGDGVPELIFGSQPERQMGYCKIPAPEHATKKWDFIAISKPGDPRTNGTFKYYHGLGVDDVNGDGREDVLIPHGWWEQPEKLDGSLWAFYPWVLGVGMKANPQSAAYLYTDDFDGDGDRDVFVTSAHAYGIWWFEQVGDGKSPVAHKIQDNYSQTHAVERADLDGDGTADYITGKRFFAHNGRDPGGKEPVKMFWYTPERTAAGVTFREEPIPAGDDTGVGTQFVIDDINDDGKPDIVLSNKKGVNVLLQR